MTLIRYAAMACLYGGFATVCTAVHYMDVETLDADDKTIWDNPQTKTVELAPPVSPAVAQEAKNGPNIDWQEKT
jgi:hypothetical protein